METVTNELYVIFHGLWAFEAREDEIRAHTPKDHLHRIAAGFLFPRPKLKDLPPGVLRLVGVKRGSKNEFSPKRNVIVHNREFDDGPGHRHCVVILPLPKQIRSLRLVDVPHTPYHVFAGVDGERLAPKRVAMVEVFVYDIDRSPDIKPPGGVPITASSATQPRKLHLFAQPQPQQAHGDSFHGRNAYTRMAQMFGLDIIPIAPLFADATDPKGPELDRSDLLGLNDPVGKRKLDLRTDSGSNCDPLVVDNVDIDE